ncbi:MAG: GAF domain-containing protein [Actinomycetota bacterium]|nr:GAF domain-containing protein [Actinomycetota bacterium]
MPSDLTAGPSAGTPGVLGFLTSDPESFARQWRRALALRIVGVALSVTLVQFQVHDPVARHLFTVLAAGIYLPISVLLYVLQRRDPTPPNLRWLAVTMCDISIIGVTQALFPRLSVAFLGLTAIVMVSAVLVGRRWALYVAAMSALTLQSAILWGGPGQMGELPATVGGLLLLGMAYLLGSLSDVQWRSADRARRLAEAIASVGSSLDLSEILERLCSSARLATDARFTIIFVAEEDQLVVGAGSGMPTTFPGGEMPLGSLLGDDAYLWSPPARALRSMAPVRIEDVRADDSLAPLLPLAEHVGFRSMISVPIERSGSAVGVLNAYFPGARTFRRGEVEFLEALAEHAGLAIERARLYAAERETAEGLRELDRLKSQFVATVSHELRTPLTAILGFAMTLRRRWQDFPEGMRNEFLDRLGDNARSLEHLITHLLDFGRMERGEFEMQLRPHDLAGLVRRLLGNMVHELSHHDVRADVPEGLVVMTDPYAFDRILGNLLSNAAKFSPAETVIEIAARREGDEVALSVRDHGKGIRAGARDRIFELFYRGPEQVRGTGIGLAVVKDLVALHGGRVEARNADPGAILTVHFVAAPGAEAREAPETVHARAQAR